MTGRKIGAARDSGDDALRAGVRLPPAPGEGFDRRRWELGAAARAAWRPRRPMGAWVAAAAVVGAAAIGGPSLVHGYYHDGQLSRAAAGQHGSGLVPGQARASTAGLSHVWMEPGGRGWAMGAAGEILSTRDGGQQWTDVSPMPRGAGPAGAFQARSAADAWWAAANAQGVAVYHTQNGGRSWRRTEIAGPARPAGWRLSSHALALGPAGTAYLLVAGNWYGKAGSPPAQPDLLWSTHNGGQTWSQRVLRGFAGGTEDAGSLFAAPGDRLLLESAGHHHLWISGTRHRGPWRVVPLGAAPAQLVGVPTFYGQRGVWMEAAVTPGAPAGQDPVRVLSTRTGGAEWASALRTWGIRPVLASVGPNAWTGATLEPGMDRAGGHGPAGQYFGEGPHALLRWAAVLRPQLIRTAVVQQLDFVGSRDQWVLVDVGSQAQLWRSTDGGRQWAIAFTGVSPAAP